MQDQFDLTKRSLLTGALAVGIGAAALAGVMQMRMRSFWNPVSIRSRCWPRSKKAELLRSAMRNFRCGSTRTQKAVS